MFKFSDDDLFPFPCPRCGDKLLKQIGWLKQNTRVHCYGCDTNSLFHKENFLRALQQAERAIDDFGQDIWIEKDGS